MPFNSFNSTFFFCSISVDFFLIKSRFDYYCCYWDGMPEKFLRIWWIWVFFFLLFSIWYILVSLSFYWFSISFQFYLFYFINIAISLLFELEILPYWAFNLFYLLLWSYPVLVCVVPFSFRSLTAWFFSFMHHSFVEVEKVVIVLNFSFFPFSI